MCGNVSSRSLGRHAMKTKALAFQPTKSALNLERPDVASRFSMGDDHHKKMEQPMRRLILGAGLTLVLAAPALAQNPSADQGTTSDQSSSSIQQQVQQNLSAAGYTDIRVMPRSFLVQATDRNGNPTMMIISPNSVTAVKQIGGEGSGNSAGMRQSAALTPGQKQKIQQATADQPAEQAPPNFQPSVGTTVPDSVALKSLPSSASSDLPPSMQGNQFAKLNDNNIIIADPSSRQVVAVINEQNSQQ